MEAVEVRAVEGEVIAVVAAVVVGVEAEAEAGVEEVRNV
jgi:hypothetical protein